MLPLLEAELPEDFMNPENPMGVSRVSLVRSPAIEVDFKNYSAPAPLRKTAGANGLTLFGTKDGATVFSANDKLQVVAGPAMLANTVIYRYDPATNEEYNVTFPASVVMACEEKFRKNPDLFSKAFNINHLEIPVSAQLQESYVTGNTGFTRIMGFDNIPFGSWMMAVHIADKKEYQDYVLEKYARGFSVEIDLPFRQIAGETQSQAADFAAQFEKAANEFATKKSVKEAIANLADMVQYNDALTKLKKYKDRDAKFALELSELNKPSGFEYYVKNKSSIQKLLSRYE